MRRLPVGPPLDPVPRLLLFDLDDTLCDYATARTRRLEIAFGLSAATDRRPRDIGRMIADSLAVQPHGVDHFPDLFRRHGIDSAGAAEEAMAWYRTNRFHGLVMFAEAAAVLADLRRGQLPRGEIGERRIGVITNGPADVQRTKIELLGVPDLVDFVVISGEFGIWKPDPAIFHEAFRLGRARPEEAVYIGDSPEYDIAGAHAAGVRSVWMNRAGAPWSSSHAPPDREVRSLTDLPHLLGAAPLGLAL